MKGTFQTLAGVITVFALLFAPHVSQAGERQPFDQKAFQAAQDAGKPVLIEVHADWCPTCKAQLPILNKLSGEPGFANIARFRVDFDSQKDALKAFNVRMQSTLIAFKGKAEVARSVGVADEARIRELVAKTL